MKKEKTVRTYQRRTKSGKIVTVRQHTASYDAAEALKEAAKKKGAGDELEALKKNSVKDSKDPYSAHGFTKDEFNEWYEGTGSANDKKVAKALRKTLGRKAYDELSDLAADNYKKGGASSFFKKNVHSKTPTYEERKKKALDKHQAVVDNYIATGNIRGMQKELKSLKMKHVNRNHPDIKAMEEHIAKAKESSKSSGKSSTKTEKTNDYTIVKGPGMMGDDFAVKDGKAYTRDVTKKRPKWKLMKEWSSTAQKVLEYYKYSQAPSDLAEYKGSSKLKRKTSTKPSSAKKPTSTKAKTTLSAKEEYKSYKKLMNEKQKTGKRLSITETTKLKKLAKAAGVGRFIE